MNQGASLLIRGGRIIDPARHVDARGDLLILDGRIADPTSRSNGAVPEFDARDLLVCPGLFDMHVHLREPGGEHKETIATGCAAAAAGGFTAVACMPNTRPPLDDPELVAGVIHRAEQAGLCRVFPVAAITRGRLGKELTDFVALAGAGAVAFSDDGDGVEDDAVMTEALRRAREADAVLIQHCEFKRLSAGGVMHRGPTAEALNLPGIDPAAEESMIERDIRLVARTGGRYHVAHISTARSVEMVRQAKREGLPVTAEVCPHHLLLTDRDCAGADPNFKMSPPLRTPEDVATCLEAVLDESIDCLVTDHAPHTSAEKAAGFREAPFGIVGLETAVGLLGTELVRPGRLDWSGFVRRMTCSAYSVLGLPAPTLTPGSRADLCLIDPNCDWTIDPARFLSRSHNTPFSGRRVTVRPVATLLAGRWTYLDADIQPRLQQRRTPSGEGESSPGELVP